MLVLVGLHLLVVHRAVRGAEINGAFGNLLDPGAGADRLIVDLNVTVSLVVFVEPLGVNGVGESSACTVDQKIALRVERDCSGENDDKQSGKLSKHSDFLHPCTWVQLS